MHISRFVATITVDYIEAGASRADIVLRCPVTGCNFAQSVPIAIAAHLFCLYNMSIEGNVPEITSAPGKGANLVRLVL
jgi:hypothetical protein